MRTFRCYNISYFVSNEIVDDIIQQMGYIEEDYDGELFEQILIAHNRYLKRTMSEFNFKIEDEIDDEDIEDYLCDNISNASGYLIDDFQYEEIKED